jgi:DNA-binding CsgD family transcriptional regulator
MIVKKTFTYVSPYSDAEIDHSLCNQLPIDIQLVRTVEDLFPLLSNPSYYTDFVCINVGLFHCRPDGLDMFDIVNTLSTLIKSTVHRPLGSGKPCRRHTKIFVVVDATTDPNLVRQLMQSPNIVSVGWIISCQEDFPSTTDHINQLVLGNYAHHQKVLELVKTKKKTLKTNNKIELTSRQSQVLQLVQDRGASNKTIARMLNLSESTIKLHMGAIFKKYGVKSRTQLAVFARDQLKSTAN